MQFLCLAIPCGRIMFHDLALEDPDLDADDAVRRFRLDMGIIDVGAQRVQRHPAFAVPFGPCDFRATQTARNVHADAKGTHTHGVLHGALHGTTEGHTTLELLGDAFADQLRVELRLAHFNDVEVQSESVIAASFLRSVSMSAPFLPMMTPGRAV